ncbi:MULTISPECIES: DUF3293 domain-containing protein [unclassified Meiothermus]|uniref:DUF3293 domain-containing protein n=1 Tax=unclassified Meiothermus TaxID=370471 RepID=UPI000D7C9D59|nr:MULTISPECIES: DUF3293 domain-containing protein [unclassified Meiothermus]PZA08023.1 DUF3293 domain-containing protein [Meiothermus sp. Pnk-1]RYM32198.1 DUF3293 domain-containing protein [Meiothermus sp. PNK-Is4]
MRSEPLAQAYQSAVYRAAGVAFTLSRQPTGEGLFAGQRFAILTAYNPGSQPLSQEENLRRHRLLEREIQRLGLTHTPSLSTSPEGTWAEEGFALFGIGLEQALELGQKFDQRAILWGEGRKVALVWCEDGRPEWFFPLVLKGGNDDPTPSL